LPPKADKQEKARLVRFVPKADISANSIVHTPQRVPTTNRMASILGQGEDRAWGCDSAKYMRSECDQRHLGLGGKRACNKDRLRKRPAQALQPAHQIDGGTDRREIQAIGGANIAP